MTLGRRPDSCDDRRDLPPQEHRRRRCGVLMTRQKEPPLSDPAAFQRWLRRSLRRRQPDASILLLRTIPGADGVAASIAMDDIHKYFAAAQRQLRRIRAAKRAAPLTRAGRMKSDIFTEIHFYFVCRAAITKRFDLIWARAKRARIGLPATKLLHRTYRERLLKGYVTARDHLEHFVDRLPGGPRALRIPGDLGNFYGDTYTIGGEAFDVSRNDLASLRAFVRKLERAMRSDLTVRRDQGEQ
jgi:hypothetical protein